MIFLIFLLFHGLLAIPFQHQDKDFAREVLEVLEIDDLSDLYADAVKLAVEDKEKEDEKEDEDNDNDNDNDEKVEDDVNKDSKDEKGNNEQEEVEEDEHKEEDGDIEMNTEGDEPSSPGQRWFKAMKPEVLDSVIAEMNGMNRWFAKVKLFCFVLRL